MSRYDDAIATMISYRWNTNKLFMRWKEIAGVVQRETGLWLNSDTQYAIRQGINYRHAALDLLDNDKIFDEVLLRAKQHQRTPVEYVAYLFGIPPSRVAQYFRTINRELPTVFRYDNSLRESSAIRKEDPERRNGDCVIRAIATALDMPYDDILLTLEHLQQSDPTKGTFDWAWIPFLKEQGWHLVQAKPWKEHTFHSLVDAIPELGKIPMIIRVPRHVFYVNESGSNIDTWDATFKTVCGIVVREKDFAYVSNAIYGEISVEGLTNKLLECRRQNPQATWLKIYEQIGIQWYEGQNLRRSAFFHMLVENTSEVKWALNGKPKPGDEIYP